MPAIPRRISKLLSSYWGSGSFVYTTNGETGRGCFTTVSITREMLDEGRFELVPVDTDHPSGEEHGFRLNIHGRLEFEALIMLAHCIVQHFSNPAVSIQTQDSHYE